MKTDPGNGPLNLCNDFPHGWRQADDACLSYSWTISMAFLGHTAAQIPQPLQ